MEDSEILNLLKSRDEGAISQTKNIYGNYIYKIAYLVLGNNDDTDECINDILLKIWDTIPPLIPKSLKAYIGTLTRNLSLDYYRKQHTQKRNVDFTVLLDECKEWVSDDCNIKLHELSNSISSYLDTVSAEKQYLFIGRYYYGYTIEELAKKRNIGISKVKTMLFRMRNELKEKLEKDGIYI